jgi:hypothetical protein
MRYYLEIHMQTIDLSSETAPNIHSWSKNKDFRDCKDIEKAPKKLQEILDVNRYHFFQEDTLEEVMAKYNITPIEYEPDCYVHGYVEI